MCHDDKGTHRVMEDFIELEEFNTFLFTLVFIEFCLYIQQNTCYNMFTYGFS